MAQSDFAGVAAALPEAARAERERPFWETLVGQHGWRWVLDAGCGGGFHLRLLQGLGVRAVGLDLAVAPLASQRGAPVLAGDVLAVPLRPVRFDAVLCLGNTFSLLADREAQRRALRALGELLAPGGMLLVQAEDAGTTVRDGPCLRTRRLPGGGVHVRVFERRGSRVRMLAGVADPGGDAALQGVWLLPTDASRLASMARPLGMVEVELPAPPAGAPGSWWLGLCRRDVTR
ncbi:MAG: class I SAM-dependent methyltransferase [Thermoanaerobaculaceae bacterium]|jgi:SAM-dependent methyltransferase|nr:class I SAM-dependent methyltransferase [Thermoanaerobaculaceae bacterium]